MGVIILHRFPRYPQGEGSLPSKGLLLGSISSKQQRFWPYPIHLLMEPRVVYLQQILLLAITHTITPWLLCTLRMCPTRGPCHSTQHPSRSSCRCRSCPSCRRSCCSSCCSSYHRPSPQHQVRRVGRDLLHRLMRWWCLTKYRDCISGCDSLRFKRQFKHNNPCNQHACEYGLPLGSLGKIIGGK